MNFQDTKVGQCFEDLNKPTTCYYVIKKTTNADGTITLTYATTDAGVWRQNTYMMTCFPDDTFSNGKLMSAPPPNCPFTLSNDATNTVQDSACCVKPRIKANEVSWKCTVCGCDTKPLFNSTRFCPKCE